MTHAEKVLRALSGTNTRARSGGASRLLVFLLIGGSVALLIWMKLRVVGSVPRTAFADPDLSPSRSSTPANSATPPDSASDPTVSSSSTESLASPSSSAQPPATHDQSSNAREPS